MKGKDLQREVINLAHLYQWKVAHFQSVFAVTKQDQKGRWRTPVAADGKGWPDLICVKKGRPLLAIEIKGDGDKLRAEQTEWLQLLHSAGVETAVVRPKDWYDGMVEALLT